MNARICGFVVQFSISVRWSIYIINSVDLNNRFNVSQKCIFVLVSLE